MTSSTTVRVAALVTAPPATTLVTTTLRDLATELGAEYRGALLVQEGSDMVGIVSERDVVRAIGEGEELDELRVADIMTEDVVTVDADANVEAAIDLMDDNEIRHLAVMDRGRCTGLLSQRDLVRHLREQLNA